MHMLDINLSTDRPDNIATTMPSAFQYYCLHFFLIWAVHYYDTFKYLLHLRTFVNNVMFAFDVCACIKCIVHCCYRAYLQLGTAY